MDDHILQKRHRIRGGWWFGNISWKVSKVVLVGWTQQIDHYALSIKDPIVRWILRSTILHEVCVFCFPITISVTKGCVLDFYFEKCAPMLLQVWGLALVGCARGEELRASGYWLLEIVLIASVSKIWVFDDVYWWPMIWSWKMLKV